MPDLETVLEVITAEFITEKVIYAREIAEINTPLYAELQRLFPESGHEIVPHVDLMGILRTRL